MGTLMTNKLCSVFGKIALAIAASSTFLISNCFAHEAQVAHEDDSLRHFLQTFDHDRGTGYIAVLRDLNGDGTPEAIVYLVSKGWCGSAGCNMLVLKRTPDSWQVISNVAITGPPIWVLTAESHGWRDIGVWVEGGGVHPGYEAELRFDGRTYPTNPSIPPAVRLEGQPTGELVISSVKDAVSLYDNAGPQKAEPEPASSRLDPKAPHDVISPSYDCARAVTATEKLVCRDRQLATMDRTMAAAYQEAMRKIPSDERGSLSRNHATWFRQYSAECNAPLSDEDRRACVVRCLSDHTRELLKLISSQ